MQVNIHHAHELFLRMGDHRGSYLQYSAESVTVSEHEVCSADTCNNGHEL